MAVYKLTVPFDVAGETVQNEIVAKIKQKAGDCDISVLETGITIHEGDILGTAYVQTEEGSIELPDTSGVQQIETAGTLQLDPYKNTDREPADDPDPYKDMARLLRQDEEVEKLVDRVSETPGRGLFLYSNLKVCDPFQRDLWFISLPPQTIVDTLTRRELLEFYREYRAVFEAEPTVKLGAYNDGQQTHLFLALSVTEQAAATEIAAQQGVFGPTNFHRLELSKAALVISESTHYPGKLDASFRSDCGETVTSRQLAYQQFCSDKPVSYHPLGVLVDGELYRPADQHGNLTGEWEPLPLETYRRGDGRPWQFGLVRTEDALILTQAMAGPEKFDPVLKRFPIEMVTLDQPLIFTSTVTNAVWNNEETEPRVQSNRSEGKKIKVLYRDHRGWHLERPAIVSESKATEKFQPTSVEGIECLSEKTSVDGTNESRNQRDIKEDYRGTVLEEEYRVTEEALLTYDEIYVLTYHEKREESVEQYQWQMPTATAYEIVSEELDEKLLEEVRDFPQDNSGMLAAGAVVDWARRTDRDIDNLDPTDVEAFSEWARRVNPGYPPCLQSEFKQVLDWITDPATADRAYEIYRAYEIDR